MAIVAGKINRGDCIEGMCGLEPGSVDLVFADPPFNIGYEYDEYDDRQEHTAYLSWSRDWMRAVYRALKPNGTFWLAIGDEYAAELKLIAQGAYPGLPLVDESMPANAMPYVERKRRRGRKASPASDDCPAGFHCRSWVIWYYTFGVHCTHKFTRSHAHLFHFVKNPKDFTFNNMDPAVRVPSARQLVYGDKRANPKGRMPDDTWILRPQDIPESFTKNEDTWYFVRVCGTFKERQGWHGCQMPEQLLGRIIRACSNEGDLVMDPFTGSGTTLVVAKKLGRSYAGFELSEEYAKYADERLLAARAGDALDGAADPLLSAPSTADGRRLDEVPQKAASKRQRSRISSDQPTLGFVE